MVPGALTRVQGEIGLGSSEVAEERKGVKRSNVQLPVQLVGMQIYASSPGIKKMHISEERHPMRPNLDRRRRSGVD